MIVYEREVDTHIQVFRNIEKSIPVFGTSSRIWGLCCGM